MFCFNLIRHLTIFNEFMKTIANFFVLLSLMLGGSPYATYAQHTKMYVGTYTSNSDSKGVYIFDFDEKTGQAILSSTIVMSNPSFLARKGNILYAVNEDTQGQLSAYDLEKGILLNQYSTEGMHPCHVALSPVIPVAVVSNYSSGSLCLYSLNEDGSIAHMDDFLQFKGSGPDKKRQEGPHIHSAFFTKDGSEVYVSDLGTDKIYVFSIEQRDGKYKFVKRHEIPTKAGGGPRHLAFSEDQQTFYSILELTGEVQVFRKSANEWKSVQILPLYSPGFDGEHGGADIKITEDGSYVLATNRGTANVLCIYEILKDGKLKKRQITSVLGDSPRNLNVSPSSNHVFITNQNTNNLIILPFQQGKVGEKLQEIEIPKPVCVIF